MKAEFTKGKVIVDGEDAFLCLSIPYRDAKKFVGEMKEGKKYSLEVKEYRKARSLDANAYAWVLMSKLSAKLNKPKEDIYREYIKDIGDNCEIVCVVDKAVDKLCEGWEHNGLGWQTERFPSKLENCTNVILYYGSSTYDTSQMSRLINLVVDDCKENEIEVLTERELSLLTSEWGARM